MRNDLVVELFSKYLCLSSKDLCVAFSVDQRSIFMKWVVANAVAENNYTCLVVDRTSVSMTSSGQNMIIVQ